ncbi:MAG: hypothetical protein NZ518_00030 [Dehalococcoidia bacterium]|nr:hypothetical protein [Dehalococcoidia bacterium]
MATDPNELRDIEDTQDSSTAAAHDADGATASGGDDLPLDVVEGALADEERKGWIPESRFREVNAELKRLREEREQLMRALVEARGQPSAEPGADKKEETKPYDFDAAEEEYTRALLEGDTAKAKQIRAEIRRHEIELARREAEQQLARRDAQTEEMRRVARVVKEAYAAFPFLDDASDQANKEAIDAVIAERDRLMQRGVPADAAIEAAVWRVAPRFARDAGKGSIADVRSASAQQALAKQPPALPKGSAGRTTAPASPLDITPDDWLRLPPEVRARFLR